MREDADLVRFRKDPKRVQRLRMLALQGLIFEAGPQTKPPRAQSGIFSRNHAWRVLKSQPVKSSIR